MSTMAEPKVHVTPEDLLAMPDGKHYELVDGDIRERDVSALSSIVTARLTSRLDQFCEAHQLGWIIGSECGYRCFPQEPNKLWRADVSFVRLDRLPEAQLSEGYLRLAPDLAAEVISPNDLAADLEQKITDYLAAGVRLVWILSPGQRTVRVHRGESPMVSLLREDDDLDGEDVLPGFRCRVGELFPGGTKGSPKTA